MKIIEILSEKMDEEICDAKAYVEMALDYREEYPELSRTLFNLSVQEMEHMNLLHNEVTSIIKRYRETDGDPPADMMAVYEYLHKKQIDKSAEVKMMQSMYRET